MFGSLSGSLCHHKPVAAFSAAAAAGSIDASGLSFTASLTNFPAYESDKYVTARQAVQPSVLVSTVLMLLHQYGTLFQDSLPDSDLHTETCQSPMTHEIYF